MRPTIKRLFIAGLFFLSVNFCDAQSPTVNVVTADSLASGNVKDILTSFFQLAFDNLIGPDKQLNFNSNPFAVMLRNNPKLAIDRNYKKYQHLRNLNFGFGLKLDTSYRFNGFSFGAKYAIINERDVTTSKWLFNQLGTGVLSREMDTLNNALLATVANVNPLDSSVQQFLTNVNLLMIDSTVNFTSLDPTFQQTVLAVAKANNLNNIVSLINSGNDFNLKELEAQNFTDLKQQIQNKPLWTVSLSDTTYNNRFAFSNVVLATQFSKGVFKQKPGSNFEINVDAAVNFLDDTTYAGNDLKRCLFSIEPGLNWVIRNRGSQQSVMELKFGGSYSHNFNRLYTGEQRDVLMFAGTFRVRIYADIWIPLEFKYDPKQGNVFGFLNVKANFKSLSKIMGS